MYSYFNTQKTIRQKAADLSDDLLPFCRRVLEGLKYFDSSPVKFCQSHLSIGQNLPGTGAGPISMVLLMAIPM